MFDIGWTEMLMIAVVAIIVIGPKDLPKVLYTVGQWVGRARAMARTFQDHVEDMARQSGIEDVRRGVQDAAHFDAARHIERTVDPDGELHKQMKAMADVGHLPPAAAPAAAVAAAQIAEAPAQPANPAEPSDTPPPSSQRIDPAVPPQPQPEPVLRDGDTVYKSPAP